MMYFSLALLEMHAHNRFYYRYVNTVSLYNDNGAILLRSTIAVDSTRVYKRPMIAALDHLFSVDSDFTFLMMHGKINWAPTNECHSIYEQFTSKAFRDITTADPNTVWRSNCTSVCKVIINFFVEKKQLSLIGSGQFGCVKKRFGTFLEDLWTSTSKHYKIRIY